MSKLTIPAPQNIKRREAFLITHKDKLPSSYYHAELLRIAHIRAEKKLRWAVPDTRLKTMEERKSQTNQLFEVVKPKQTLFSKVKNMFKAQRGN